MNPFEARRVSDPVHGSLGLSELEVQVINTPAFQRLRHIKQLGLANYVFPGADYSRLAHSIGVCHVTGRTLQVLRDYDSGGLTDVEIQRYRLAALLHDIGHYPFSHAMEEAISNHYSEALLEEGASDSTEPTTETPYSHERASKEVVLSDPDIQKIIDESERRRIAAIFLRETPPPYANLVSSDLDADRIDYLLRSAHHTGLPYGDLDINYLISQMRLDNKRRVCLTSKAVRAADHFLLARYFDYQQVAFNKTVVALELLLKDVLQGMLQHGYLKCSATDVDAMIRNGRWSAFDDSSMIQLMREACPAVESKDATLKRKIEALIARRAPKLIAQREYIAPRDQQETFLLIRRMVRERVEKWAKSTGVDARLWYVWDRPGIVLTKIGGSVPLTAAAEHDTEDEEAYEQAIRVLSPSGYDSTPIVELKHSLMSVLSNQALYALRVYALLPDGVDRSKLREEVMSDLPEAHWE